MRERVSVRVRETEAEMIEKHRQETDWKRKKKEEHTRRREQ